MGTDTVQTAGVLTRSVRVDSLLMQSSLVKEEWPHVQIQVDVSNPTSRPISVTEPLRLVMREFVGNPASRVVQPGDIKRTVLDTRDLSVRLESGENKSYKVEFHYEAPAKFGSGRTTYTVDNGGDKPLVIGFFAPPKPASAPH